MGSGYWPAYPGVVRPEYPESEWRALAKKDLEDALTLFLGLDPGSPTSSKLEFPSTRTKPTEKVARAALVRALMTGHPPEDILMALAASIDFDEYQRCVTLLRRMARAQAIKEGKATGKGPFTVLGKPGEPDYSNPDHWVSFAEHWYPDPDPDGLRAMSYRRLVFKNLSQGHHDPRRVFQIASLWPGLRRRHGYTKALEEIAKRFGVGTDQVKRILKKLKGRPWFDFSSHGDGR